MFYIKPVKEEVMYMDPRISMFHDVVTPSEIAVVRRIARPRVTAHNYLIKPYKTDHK